MPKTRVIFYQEKAGDSPVLDWLWELRATNEKAWANCRARIEQLAELGHELRRPAADICGTGFMN